MPVIGRDIRRAEGGQTMTMHIAAIAIRRHAGKVAYQNSLTR